jgi:predicted nucleotidyltransferase
VTAGVRKIFPAVNESLSELTNVLIMSTQINALGDLLFGQTRGRVLALLFGHPDETFFVRQIARHAGTSVGTVQRELETLSRLGLIERSVSGRQVYYKANGNHPVFAELSSLIAKTVGVFQLLGAALAPFANRVSLAFVYGSTARRDETAESDVDLMVVGDVTLDEVLTQLAPVERAVGRPINPTVFSVKEFKSKLQNGNHFLRAVMRGEKVFLIGEEDELGKMG